jgi:hypothetical protein
MTVADKRRWFEIIAVGLTGALKYILMDWLELRLLYIFGVCVFWAVYIRKRYQADPEILKNWGFRRDNFRKAVLFILPYAAVIIATIVAYGIWENPRLINWHLIPVLLLYPAWGTVQQFMMIGLIALNLKNMSTLNLKHNYLVLLISLLFSIAHFPSFLLMGFTFIMELLFLVSFFKYRNLWPLGLFHGWIGGLLLFLVLERNVWSELWVIF